MMILSQDGMVAVNSDNVAMFEVKETETIPHEAQLMATIFISGGGRYTNAERICYTLLGRSAAMTAPSSQSSRWTTFRSASALATRSPRRFRPKMK